jgi:hypothetical protein
MLLVFMSRGAFKIRYAVVGLYTINVIHLIVFKVRSYEGTGYQPINPEGMGHVVHGKRYDQIPSMHYLLGFYLTGPRPISRSLAPDSPKTGNRIEPLVANDGPPFFMR